ncbi:transmembrane protein with EGF like and two follistatin like domains 2 [Phyllostomus discolor]|uniref:Transmembrane protein with EGF like and two follistatin like domains 2 n=1 Tax=Phyllostomus discolor TaxID=89673 RepID=A0A834AL44_9CHIR|nr:transmembrane protein with EGF like and two follistatin like domains 2 [Phyllostomus discolor]
MVLWESPRQCSSWTLCEGFCWLLLLPIMLLIVARPVKLAAFPTSLSDCQTPTGWNCSGYDDRENDLFLCDTNTCKFDGECLRIGDTVTCVCQFKCNIDCSQTNFNPLCASDGKSYDNACQIKEASCQKQEKIEVMSLGRCQDNTTTTTKSEDGHYARTDYAENANKLEESAREHHIPCPEHYNGFCMHGKCEHSINMQEPSCRCDAGYTGQHCEKKDYSVLYVVPGPVRFQYVLIAAVIGTIQIAVICVVVLCITRKCPRSNRIHRQKQNTGHYSSDNTTRASTRLI